MFPSSNGTVNGTINGTVSTTSTGTLSKKLPRTPIPEDPESGKKGNQRYGGKRRVCLLGLIGVVVVVIAASTAVAVYLTVEGT